MITMLDIHIDNLFLISHIYKLYEQYQQEVYMHSPYIWNRRSTRSMKNKRRRRSDRVGERLVAGDYDAKFPIFYCRNTELAEKSLPLHVQPCSMPECQAGSAKLTLNNNYLYYDAFLTS